MLAQPFEGRARDLDRRPVLVRPDRVEAPQRVLVAQDDRHVVVGALVDEEAAPARPEHEQADDLVRRIRVRDELAKPALAPVAHTDRRRVNA